MGRPIIQISNLVKTYKLGGETVHALNNVSIEIEKGEFLAIIGPSGSGKSTLMNMIGCLDRPQSGKYLLDGKDIERMNDNQLAVIRNQKKSGLYFKTLTC